MRKTQSTERENTVLPILEWTQAEGIWCVEVEAKAVYSPAAGMFLQGQAPSGTPDIIGCTPKGLAFFVEAKARGKTSTLRQLQHTFLLAAIHRGAFAVAVDSLDRLIKYYRETEEIDCPQKRKKYLLSVLPTPNYTSFKPAPLDL